MTIPNDDRIISFLSEDKLYAMFVRTAIGILGGSGHLVEMGGFHAHLPWATELTGQRIQADTPSLRTVEHLQPYLTGDQLQPHVRSVLDQRLHLYLITEHFPNGRPIGKPRLLLHMPGFASCGNGSGKVAADIWWPPAMLRHHLDTRTVDYLSDLKEQVALSLYLRRIAAAPAHCTVSTGT